MSQADDPARNVVVNLALLAVGTAVGTAGAYRGAYGLLAQQARIARRVIPKPTSRPFHGDGLYRPGAETAEPWRPGMTCDVHMMVFGDSLAAGLGADSPGELPGVLLARGLAEESGWDVRLSVKAIVGATSKGLEGQIEAMQIAHGDPDISVILVGGNDITARHSIGPAAKRVGEAVEALREGGSHVVVGTCPDLGIIKAVPQPLRSVMATLSRRLAAAQSVQVRRAGGVPVSLAEALAPEFHQRGDSLFSPDRFHPNSAGYELAAGLLLPAVCVALGVWDEVPDELLPHGAEEAAASLEAAELAADDAETAAEETADASTGANRESVVARLTKRLTDFVRTHEDADDVNENTYLHNEDVDGDPESTGDAREAADTLRRRSRILRLTRSTRDPSDSDPSTDHT
ncbi:SGNH/GDSL hydrolase family protein [Dietzia sp. PP-33]|jgi:lysophospholipase L1-like esterase|uniref:SGNH/GDSL hydrolase family protein n=1 Tax=Dietzia sp. PP-33 TaxID=2957500 RepID=UPI0029A0B6D9|nr:SGNH/GDSL hydrolase family protein [Dietzia sp. PP-33]MDX2355927.1 SGNH/GDSL hydrolase family protein [Dietzia sp. PP-33]